MTGQEFRPGRPAWPPCRRFAAVLGAAAGAWLAVVGSSAARGQTDGPSGAAVTIRVAAVNAGGLTTADLASPGSPRLRALAEMLQRVRPNIVLVCGVAADMAGSPGVPPGAEPLQNGRRLAAALARPAAADLAPISAAAFLDPVNSGAFSGLDLDHSGSAVGRFPDPARSAPTGADAAAFSGDCWGPGAYPGERGMVLLADTRIDVLTERVRTFRRLPWDYMPGAFLPRAEGGGPWHTADELAVVRLSSAAHWDVPVRLPSGAVVHFLCSFPAPPGQDTAGPAARRNHDEIRFWADYIENAAYIVDDRDRGGGLDFRASYVVLGDLGVDPDGAPGFKDPVGTALLTAPRLNAVTPLSDPATDGRGDATGAQSAGDSATNVHGLRTTYVLPSADLEVLDCGVRRDAAGVGEHFPVVVTLRVPPPRPGAGPGGPP